ncbi:MAG: hypothetical protein A2X66_07295, partial [Ignavibacteria bacterium GWA2_54_16]
MNARIVEALKTRFGEKAIEASEFRGELTLVVPGESIVEVCRFLRDDPVFKFDFLADLSGLDMFTPAKRFAAVYNLYSLSNKHRIRLKVFTEEEDPKLPTVTGVWGTANWHE